LILDLDSLMSLRETAHAADFDLMAAASLADLAGVEAVRVAIDDHPSAVRERDVADARRATRRLELQMPANPGLLKVALEARPERVLLAGSTRDGGSPGDPLDLGTAVPALGTLLRSLEEAGLVASLRIPPRLDAVKIAHAEGAAAVELFTGSLFDLPPAEREAELTALAEAVRLAAKLRMSIGIGGGLGYRTVPEVLEVAPAIERVAVGRAAIGKALLIGLDRALRDLRALVQ
jgi:pyridoxine 5-phosphate synthase